MLAWLAACVCAIVALSSLSLHPLGWNTLSELPAPRRVMYALHAALQTTRSQESPAFFRRGEFYYLITGDLCCFCQAGSDAKVMVSREGPLGPFVPAGQLNGFGTG